VTLRTSQPDTTENAMNNTEVTHEMPREILHAHLKETLEHLTAAGHSAHELVKLSIDTFGRKAIPVLKEFQDEVRSGKIKVENVTEFARTALFGIHVSPQQREQMIRDAAYFHAEKRGFAGASPQEDWLKAEQEVDRFLAKQEGVIVKSRKSVESITAFTERGLSQLRDRVDQWIKSSIKTKSYH
jgi:Protein of unknown function (DUF2934)